jgi:hypothetical protein
MGSWNFLANHEGAQSIVLLTDGSVLCQSVETPHLMRFHPDDDGDYIRGK